MTTYERSAFYQLGKTYATIGQLLLDESTTLRKLVKTMADLDQSIQIRFVADIDAANEADTSDTSDTSDSSKGSVDADAGGGRP